MALAWIIRLISLVPILIFLRWMMTSYLTRSTGLSSILHGNVYYNSSMVIGRTSLMTGLTGLVLGPLIVSSPFSNRSRYYLKMVVYFLGMAIASSTGILAGLIFPIVRPSWRNNIQWLVARVFHTIVSPIVGWEFVVEGEEYLEPCYQGQSHVLVGNHQSILDILFLGRIFPRKCVVMSKKEVKWVPLLGQYMVLSRAVFIDRKNRANASESLKKAAEDMKRHRLTLFIFPEGTRLYSSKPDLLPFKQGAFRLASQSDLKVTPIICENYTNIFNSKLKVFNSGKVLIKVFEPMSIKEGENVQEFSDRVRKVMLDGLIEFSNRKGSISNSSN
ncbi:hypothetical protein BY996DRAFT_4597812 [Phakopsora pachyrhizi]|uniref:1-acyl-sn-glycerol-3-phosphate acyltransferase n=1 Tax=Phakopsora pachyrhizi TaxID=170000 RepID=A0AAV0B6F9_PHAPC|nr:hypothetical protein BY996DRAFT_4597812 [Phakopsora pachyrhizi]CAH7681896.1 hypothetical protein PPACK8108_LOCUS14569 [Phakopsora pachyrhizi]